MNKSPGELMVTDQDSGESVAVTEDTRLQARQVHEEIIHHGTRSLIHLLEFGRNLKAMRDRKLYLALDTASFGAYCERIQVSRRVAYERMAVAEMVDSGSVVQAPAQFNYSQLALLAQALPEDRPALAAQAPDMTTRQLEVAVREANQAKKAAEEAKRENAELARRLDKANKRAEAAESQPPKVIEKDVTRTIFQDSPETRAIIDRLSRDLLDKKQTLEQRQKDTDRLQKLLTETGKDLDKLRAQADRSATLETEIQEKAQQLQQLSAIHKRLGANFDDEGRDPSGGLKLLSAVRVVDDAMLTTLGDVQLLKRAGVGGWCEDERLRELSKRLKQLSGLLDAIVEDREKRVIDVTPTEVQ